MADPELTLDYLEQQIPSLSAAAVDVAYWQALASGQAVLVSGDGGIYQAFADGTKKTHQNHREATERACGNPRASSVNSGIPRLRIQMAPAKAPSRVLCPISCWASI
jgi:hypothetical protein